MIYRRPGSLVWGRIMFSIHLWNGIRFGIVIVHGEVFIGTFTIEARWHGR